MKQEKNKKLHQNSHKGQTMNDRRKEEVGEHRKQRPEIDLPLKGTRKEADSSHSQRSHR